MPTRSSAAMNASSSGSTRSAPGSRACRSGRAKRDRGSMNVLTVDPNIDTGALLAGAQFCDAYSAAVDGSALDARGAAERMLGHRPRWIGALMALRNTLVAPFGL